MHLRLVRLTSFIMFCSLCLSACRTTAQVLTITTEVENNQVLIVTNTPVPPVNPIVETLCAHENDQACQTMEAEYALQPISPTPAVCDELSGRVERRSYPGVISGEEIPVLVYLPPCYDPYLKLYPVLFLLHGKPQDERHWLILGIDDVVDQGIQQGKWPPFIMVMPQQPEPLFTQSDGGPGSLEQELVQGLLPYILDRFPVTSEEERWAIAGVSRGGIWALEIGFRHGNVFRQIAALSPALNVNYARPAYDPMVMATELDPLPERVFLGAGTNDSARTKTGELMAILDDLDLRSQYLEVTGSHESSTWIQMIPEMLSFLTENW